MFFALQIALADTHCSDVHALAHDDNNILLTLQDEANDSRAIQIRKYSDTSFTLCDSYANGKAFYYDASSLDDLCASLVSMVVI